MSKNNHLKQYDSTPDVHPNNYLNNSSQKNSISKTPSSGNKVSCQKKYQSSNDTNIIHSNNLDMNLEIIKQQQFKFSQHKSKNVNANFTNQNINKLLYTHENFPYKDSDILLDDDKHNNNSELLLISQEKTPNPNIQQRDITNNHSLGLVKSNENASLCSHLNTKNNSNPQIKARNVINPYYSNQKHISTLSPNQTIPEEGNIISKKDKDSIASNKEYNINNMTYTTFSHTNNKTSMKSLRKKKEKNSMTRTNEHIIYDPYNNNNTISSKNTKKDVNMYIGQTKKSSSEEKRIKPRNNVNVVNKSKKRQSIKTHGEVKKMLTTHFIKPSFMRTACSPENSSS